MPAGNVYLSLVITTYKRNHWLQECLESILTSIQSYQRSGGNEAIEIIVCDDDTTQRSFPIDDWKNRFNAYHTAFYYQINQKNLGDYFNRNAGIKKSSGKWVKFIDDDDLIYDWTVSFIIEKLFASANANTVIFYVRDNFRHLKFPIVLNEAEIFKFHYSQYGLFHCSLVSAVFLRADLVKSGGFKFKRFYGDFQIFHDMAVKGCFYIYPIELGWYRMHENQESGNNRDNVMIRFNYLVYSFHFFMQNPPFGDIILKQLQNDCKAYIKHALKRFDVILLRKAIRLYVIMQGSSKSKKPFEVDREQWFGFYQKQLQFSNNAIVERGIA